MRKHGMSCSGMRMVHVPPYGERVGHGSAHLALELDEGVGMCASMGCRAQYVARSAKVFYYVASLENSFTTNEFSCVWKKNSIG